MTMTIRPFGPNDACAVNEMMHALAAFHQEDIPTTSNDFVKAFTGDSAVGHCLVAVVDDKPIGFAATYDWVNMIRAKRICNIDLIFVAESARRHGLGKMLMQDIVRRAAERGCSRIDVGAVETNETSNAFYQGLGFDRKLRQSVGYRLEGDQITAFISAG